MSTWARYFGFYAAFTIGVGTFYYVLTGEDVGWIVLTVAGLACAATVAWAWRRGAFRERRRDDDPDADPGADAGEEVGDFPVASVWPLVLVGASVAIGAAIVYGLILLPLGVLLMGWAILGLMRESRD
ncbi:MAG TPA: cytochrome c oxidase subunit 4 [Actinomycetota bacterium]|nr:cytochrome c oxidase subunit 4 [Actinomycetota bacterium]